VSQFAGTGAFASLDAGGLYGDLGRDAIERVQCEVDGGFGIEAFCWRDEPIPALGGRTPCDAVADPDDAAGGFSHVDSFPVPGDSGVEDVDRRRLRSALGLQIERGRHLWYTSRV
jgi:hypothetical protein